jgi:hypothetical protein
MPIIRHAPGEVAPWTGTYALVGHYGECTDLAVLCRAGQRLPVVTVTTDNGPFWFVLVDEANEGTRAA